MTIEDNDVISYLEHCSFQDFVDIILSAIHNFVIQEDLIQALISDYNNSAVRKIKADDFDFGKK